MTQRKTKGHWEFRYFDNDYWRECLFDMSSKAKIEGHLSMINELHRFVRPFNKCKCGKIEKIKTKCSFKFANKECNCKEQKSNQYCVKCEHYH